jgi:hypothetical protein
MSTETPADQGEHDSARPSKVLEIAFAAIALGVASAYLLLGMQIELRRAADPGQIDARFWPVMLGTLAVAVSIALLVIAIARPAPGREDIDPIRRGGVLRVITTSALTIVYVLAWSFSSVIAFGYRIQLFPIVTAIYLIALMLVYGQRKIIGLIVYPVLVTAFIYVVFGLLLRVPL